MNILGYSGLHNSIKLRKSLYKNLTEQEYRMCQGLDSSACVMVDGGIVAAAEEERFNREKYTCDFPIHAIHYCLHASGRSIDDFDYICHGFNYQPHQSLYALRDQSKHLYENVLSPDAQKQHWKKHFPQFNIDAKFVPVDHHLAHAATAFYPSGFDAALILVADGIGETYSLSLYKADQLGIQTLKQSHLMSSLGVLYSQITSHLGFWVNSDEYKIMGLAPYGDSSVYKALFDELIHYRDDGTISIRQFSLNKTEIERQTGRGFRRWLSKRAFHERQPEEPILQKHKDFAAGLQRALETSLMHILHYWKTATHATNLCLAGGVALNCTANGVILREGLFDDVFVQSAASDAGTSMGAALVQHAACGNASPVRINRYSVPSYGPSFDDKAYKVAIEKYTDTMKVMTLSTASSLVEEAAKWIADQKVIAWMQGGMEFGPRALGHRSILADPSNPTMREHINALVKKREGFRPFAPSVKLECAAQYFEIPEHRAFPHMLYTVKVRTAYRAKLPAITHVDGTARIQTVDKKHSPLYWSLLDSVEKATGYPMVLNTSFNVKGQPIVCTPEEAIKTFISTKIDALFMGNYCISHVSDPNFAGLRPCPSGRTERGCDPHCETLPGALHPRGTGGGV